jgi:SsrA-binding protein
MKIKIISQVKKNFRDYRIIEKFTVGIVLNGSEIKSLRTHQSSIDEAYILPYHHELYIINMYIKAYSYSQKTNYDEKRRKKILLRKREIKKIIKQLKSKNYSLVPLLLFINERG